MWISPTYFTPVLANTLFFHASCILLTLSLLLDAMFQPSSAIPSAKAPAWEAVLELA